MLGDDQDPVLKMEESAVQAEVTKWAKLDNHKLRTLPGLMQLLQADERPEADQPEVTASTITLTNLNALLGDGGHELFSAQLQLEKHQMGCVPSPASLKVLSNLLTCCQEQLGI